MRASGSMTARDAVLFLSRSKETAAYIVLTPLYPALPFRKAILAANFAPIWLSLDVRD